MNFEILKNEYWFGGAVQFASMLPLGYNRDGQCDTRRNLSFNPSGFYYLSTKGRTLHSSRGFEFSVKDNLATVSDYVLLDEAGKTLRDAFLFIRDLKFGSGTIKLPAILFEKPQFNSWIELGHEQNEDDISHYMESLRRGGMPGGVLMIDDIWSEYYGDYCFNRHFRNPERLVDTAAKMGFELMLWTSPFITPDSIAFREMERKNLLVKKDGNIFITKWWNGNSALLDFRNPETAVYFNSAMKDLMDLGIKGFKFDGGDSMYYPDDGDLQSKLWAENASMYAYNEVRNAVDCQGKNIFLRLCDKTPTWDGKGLNTLLPDTIQAGLMGYPFTAPDMIGGGEFTAFVPGFSIDEELFIRHAELSSMMPCWQFSANPFRCLSSAKVQTLQAIFEHRCLMMGYMRQLRRECEATKEPMIRSLCYEFDDDRAALIKDEAMLGHKYLIAPILEKGKSERDVYLPSGVWEFEGQEYRGGASYSLHLKGPGPIVVQRVRD